MAAGVPVRALPQLEFPMRQALRRHRNSLLSMHDETASALVKNRFRFLTYFSFHE